MRPTDQIDDPTGQDIHDRDEEIAHLTRVLELKGYNIDDPATDTRSKGHVAFDAYNESKGGVTYDGKPIPPWGEVGAAVQHGWEEAAEAVAQMVEVKIIETLQRLGHDKMTAEMIVWADGDGGSIPLSVRQWQKAIHDYAKSKGWWDEDKPRSFGDLCMLFVSEVAEAYEEYRSHKGMDEVYFNPEKPEKPEGIPVELADTVIRILDWFGAMGIDLQTILEQKHAYNQKRPYRHGNRKA